MTPSAPPLPETPAGRFALLMALGPGVERENPETGELESTGCGILTVEQVRELAELA